MQAFSIVTGPAAPLFVSNVDTDTIIGHEAMSSSPEELAPYAFGALRYLPDGTANPGFVLNQPKYRAAPILLAGPNFGCGSSRERAVWALVGIGIRCIVAPSFTPRTFSAVRKITTAAATPLTPMSRNGLISPSRGIVSTRLSRSGLRCGSLTNTSIVCAKMNAIAAIAPEPAIVKFAHP